MAISTTGTVEPQVLADALKAIGHPLRLRIIQHLFDYDDPTWEASVKEIELAVAAPQAIVSQHLTLMRDRGYLASRKQGTQVFYRLDPQFRELNNVLTMLVPSFSVTAANA